GLVQVSVKHRFKVYGYSKFPGGDQILEMHVRGFEQQEHREICAEARIKPPHLFAGRTRLRRHELRPTVATAVDNLENASRVLEAFLVDPFDEFSEVHIHGLAVRLIYELPAGGKRQNRNCAALTMGVSRICGNRGELAGLHSRRELTTNQLPILRQAAE